MFAGKSRMGKSLTRTCSIKRPTTALADHNITLYALCIQFGRWRCLKHVLNELSSRSRQFSRKNIGKFLIVFDFSMTFCKVLTM